MDSAAALVDALAAVAPRYSGAHRDEKLRLLQAIRGRRIGSARALLRLHESLCFLQAYPDDALILVHVDRALAEFPARVRRLTAGALQRLYDTGIAGSTLDYPFGYPMAAWLARERPGEVDVDWRRFEGGEGLEEALALVAHPAEDDAFSEGGMGWRRWLALARGGRPGGDLAALLDLFARAPWPEAVRDRLFESLGLPVRWRLRAPRGTRTDARLPGARPFFHAGGLRRPSEHLIREIARPLPRARRAGADEAAELIRAARFAMATRQRELFAFSHPNPADVWVTDPAPGLRVVLIGLAPAWSLPFDGYYAFMALKNGVPLGYGGGWGMFGTLEFAVNVFPSFRRGESAFTVSQVMRVYRQLLGAAAFVVDPYQLGQGNAEALRSGAVYFYLRLGFRPRDPETLAVLRGEEARMAREPGYRSPLSVLRRLARGEVYLTLPGGDPAPERRVRPAELAGQVTRFVVDRFGGDRARAASEATAAVARALGARRPEAWPADQRRALERWALVLGQIEDLRRWPGRERRRLLGMIRAKGRGDERSYLRLLQGSRRLGVALRRLLGTPGG